VRTRPSRRAGAGYRSHLMGTIGQPGDSPLPQDVDLFQLRVGISRRVRFQGGRFGGGVDPVIRG
jgi:hypothetical protein